MHYNNVNICLFFVVVFRNEGYPPPHYSTLYKMFCQIQCYWVSNSQFQQLFGCYNPSQTECIKAAAQAVCASYMTPKMLLLQGPPGTGKTHTISGLIRTVFQVSAFLSECTCSGYLVPSYT